MVKIYTLDTCPKCKILKEKLNSKNISYEEVTDVDIMISLNISSVPVLELEDGSYLNFSEANKWINEQGE